MMKKLWIIVYAVHFGVISPHAQPLDSMLYGINGEDNPALRAGYFGYQALLQRETQALQWPEPEFNLDFIAFPFPNRSFMPSATFGLMQPIPWKGVREGKAALALAEANTALEGVRVERLELRFQLKEAYWQLFELGRSAGLIAQNLDLLKALERLAQSNLELGRGTMDEVLEVKMRILALEQQLRQLQNARRNPQATINRILDRAADTPVFIAETPAGLAPMAADTPVREEITARYPGLLAIDHETSASLQRQLLNRLDSRPSVQAGLDYVLMNTGEGAHTTDGRDMLMPRVGVRLPIFRQTYYSRGEEERLRQAALANQKKVAENTLLASLEQAQALWEDARIQYQTAREQMPLVESAIRLAETALATDQGGLDKILRLYEQLLSVKLQEVQAITKSHLAVAAFERWTDAPE
jgi:cobalt-zinc-cadmium efflux system outer membrane protein